MHCRLILWSIGIVLALVSGCVSKSQLSTVNTEHQLAQQQIAEAEKRIDVLDLSIQKLKNETNQCKKGKKQLRQKIKKLNAENKLLSQKVGTLGETIKEKEAVISLKEAVISLQETFIRLFDDSKQTIQKSINKQIQDQNR